MRYSLGIKRRIIRQSNHNESTVDERKKNFQFDERKGVPWRRMSCFRFLTRGHLRSFKLSRLIGCALLEKIQHFDSYIGHVMELLLGSIDPEESLCCARWKLIWTIMRYNLNRNSKFIIQYRAYNRFQFCSFMLIQCKKLLTNYLTLNRI